jgi:hypothetical protein
MNISTLRQVAAIVLCLAFSAALHAQTDTIRLASHDLKTGQLKEGLHQYLVYLENPKKKMIAGHSLWNRQVTFKTIAGREVIEVVQRWHSADTTRNRYVYSICDRATFAPHYHYARSARSVEAFNFETGKIIGADSVGGNSKKGFELILPEPTLNWEMDLEVFNTLPIKKVGQRFIINFYHPGGSAPKFYEYKIIADGKLQTLEGRPMDCWQLKINYTETDWAIFWISKKSNEVIKMQEHFRGLYRYKVRVATPVAETKG